MNRWIWPAAVLGVVAAVTVSATVTGAQPIPETPFAATETRVSVVCPGFESATASVGIAAAAVGPGLRTASVADAAAGSDAGTFTVVRSPGAPLRVSALLPDPFGGISSVSAEAGPDRGLSASVCASPSTDHWFTGVDIRTVAQSEVVVANLDQTTASVDLTVYGEEGTLAAPRGIEVEGNSVQTISFGTIERSQGPVSVEVSSGDGRVAAFVRQRTWAADVPLGADWLPESTAPSTDMVIPGMPSGSGERTVVVTNPGELTATVSIGTLTTSGSGQLAGAEQWEVPPQSTRTLDLQLGLDGQPAALRLTSTQPVSAGVWLDAGGNDARHDPAFTAATVPLPSDSIWPLALGKQASSVLQLANPDDTDATVTVSAGTGTAPGEPSQVTVPAGSIVEVELAKAATNLVRVQTSASNLRGALIATAQLGKVRGLSVVDLSADDSHRGEAPVVFDPHAGS